jgi:hypothetical protein
MGENIEPRGDKSNPHLHHAPPPDRGKQPTPAPSGPSVDELQRFHGLPAAPAQPRRNQRGRP